MLLCGFADRYLIGWPGRDACVSPSLFLQQNLLNRKHRFCFKGIAVSISFKLLKNIRQVLSY